MGQSFFKNDFQINHIYVKLFQKFKSVKWNTFFLNNCNEISLYLQPFLAHNSIVTFGRNVHLISIKFLKQMRIVHYNAIHKKTCKSHKICSLHAKKLIFSFEFHLKMQWRWRRCTVALGADRMPKVSVGYSNRRRLIILWRVEALQKNI